MVNNSTNINTLITKKTMSDDIWQIKIQVQALVRQKYVAELNLL
jgi:hypothetical protein